MTDALTVDWDDDVSKPMMPAVESFETAIPVKEVRRAPTTPSRAEPPPTATRVLPHSLNAEVGLLGTLFVDTASVLARCHDAGLSTDSFYDRQNGAFYECIDDLHSRNVPVDTATVAVELQNHPAFSGHNLFALVAQVSSATSTTAQAAFFVEQVREYALRRALILKATSIAQRASDTTESIDEFADKAADSLRNIASASSQILTDRLDARAFNVNRQLERPKPIYQIAGTVVSTPGNLTSIYSQAKTGKSPLTGAMMAAAMTTPTSRHDTLSVEGPNYANHALLHFDTEQSLYDWQQLVCSSLRRVDLPEPPPWLLSYNLTGVGARECRDLIRSAMRTAHRKFGGIHSIIIDGIADLVVDPNDADECFPLITELHALAIEYNTAIIVILHLNPGSQNEKGRGHLGSQLERKSESNLTLTKDGETTVISSTRQRGRPIPKDDKAPSFRWSDDRQMHVSCGVPEAMERPKNAGAKQKYTFAEFRPIFPSKNEPGKTASMLHRAAVQNVPGLSPNSFYNLLQRFIKEDMLDELPPVSGQRYYRMKV